MKNENDLLAECRYFYELHLKSKFGEPVGCSKDEILDFESKNEVELPFSYKQYLLWMGNDHEGVFRGSEWFFNRVLKNTEYLPEFLCENNVSCLNKGNALCFFSHQGYMSA